jgi:DNA primase large subunit
MMDHLLDALEQGQDIGHYGRLVFTMVGRFFLTPDELAQWLEKDPDCDEAQARTLIAQVEERGYNPPKREKIQEWAGEQEFPLCPDDKDRNCGNVYRNLKFPDEVYQRIQELYAARAESR